MKTLEEFNNDRRAEIVGWIGPHPNGIACGCGSELLDSEPLVTLTTNPPLKAVHCLACGFRGNRLA